MAPKFSALAAAAVLGVATACGIQPNGVCGAAARTTLLAATTLEPWVPTTPFTVSANVTVWAEVTKLPVTAGGLFGDVGPVADLHPILSGTAPALVVQANGDTRSIDRDIGLNRPPGWQLQPIQPGTWQVYSDTDPQITIVACPKGG
jgi:hypothetical protein